MTITIAPKGNTAPADVRLDGTTDMAVLAKYVTQAGADVKILKGIVNLNGGASGDPSGGGYLRPGKGATITGEVGTVLESRSSIVRLTLDKPGVTLRQLSFKGKGHIQWFDTGSGSLLEDVTVDQSDDNGKYYDLSRNCTAAFLFYAKKGTTLRNVTLRRCTAIKSYHHGFSMHVYSYQEGATFENFLFDDCKAISCGSGLLSPRDWSTGFNTADTGNLKNVRLVDCHATDCYQSGFHCDGNWTGHAQTVEGLVYDRCSSIDAGQRCSPGEIERFCCGFYGQSATYIDCTSQNCANAGFGIKNEKANSLIIKHCVDVGSAYGLILEYAAPGAKVYDFVSNDATIRSFQGQVTAGGTLDLTLINPPKTAITFGRTQRIDYIQCPGHQSQIRDKYDKIGYTVDGSKVTIYSSDNPAIEVWKASHMDLSKIVYKDIADHPVDATVVDTPEVPPIVLPPEPQPHLLSEDGCIKTVLPDGTKLMLVGGGFMDPAAREEFPHGSRWKRVVE